MRFKSDIIIGLEVHAQLNTRTKLFCSCPAHPNNGEMPNSRCCPVCLGHPGSKPVVNKKAVEFAVKLCLALNCTLSPELVFSRKSYFYPDLAKNYQISQYEMPLGVKGKLRLDSGKEIGITRVHMEEDPAALVHPGSMDSSQYVLVDYNRSGNPLVEIVTEPEMESPAEARDFMKRLITVLNYLEIFDENSCIIKADANVSVRESGYVKHEVKNITGFKEIERALAYEVGRQRKEAGEGKELVQETRAWDSSLGATFSLRSKETEEDYGYIIDPDLTIITISDDWVGVIRESMPELADSRKERYLREHRLSETDAKVLSQEKRLAELFEKVAEKVDPVLAARWLRRELVRVMNYNKKSFEELEIDESHLIDLLSLVEKKEITCNVAQKIIEMLIEKPFDVKGYVKKQNLKVVSGSDELERVCSDALKEAPKAVEEYKAGQEKALNFIVGIVMRMTKGRADPSKAKEVLTKLIG